tara:strand:- start:52 stop:240 length:189 start_codon:yes stop_codon:yes gene_type:complete
MKSIVVEIADGLVRAVYCPNEGYEVHILDRDDARSGDGDHLVQSYYADLEDLKNKLVDCTSI